MSGVQHLVQSGPLILAAPVAAAAGAITFLSPCCLPLVPGYLSYVTGMSGTDAQRAAAADGPPASVAAAPAAGAAAADGSGGVSVAAPAAGVRTGGPAAGPARGRTVLGTLLFVLGFSLVFATEGLAFGSLGLVLQRHSAGVTQVLGALTIVLGLLFAGVFDRFPVTGRIARPSFRPRAGLAGAPLLGVLFALSWTPCVGPTLSVVLTMSFTSGTALRGAVLAFIYGLGLGIPFLIVAFAFQRGMTAFGWARRHARLIARIGGGLLVLVGVLEVTGAWTAALTWLKVHWIGSYQAPL
ncbi:MAG TPA: cytochrome c biogenesis protein CcdA [Streptosporangiaceae bacterium]|nr:cytochrome c biogenesis protein CcdA [Streptosporangiaceae bacterium]